MSNWSLASIVCLGKSIIGTWKIFNHKSTIRVDPCPEDPETYVIYLDNRIWRRGSFAQCLYALNLNFSAFQPV